MTGDLFSGGVLVGALLLAYCVGCDAVDLAIRRWRGER